MPTTRPSSARRRAATPSIRSRRSSRSSWHLRPASDVTENDLLLCSHGLIRPADGYEVEAFQSAQQANKPNLPTPVCAPSCRARPQCARRPDSGQLADHEQTGGGLRVRERIAYRRELEDGAARRLRVRRHPPQPRVGAAAPAYRSRRHRGRPAAPRRRADLAGLLVVGELPGYPVIGHTVAGRGIEVR